eukprot:Rmarinus@m.19504
MLAPEAQESSEFSAAVARRSLMAALAPRRIFRRLLVRRPEAQAYPRVTKPLLPTTPPKGSTGRRQPPPKPCCSGIRDISDAAARREIRRQRRRGRCPSRY